MDQYERSASVFRLMALAIVIGLASTTLGCLEEYDFERDEYQRGTLGEELFGIWYKDAKRAADKREQKSQMLMRRRFEFVTAVDAIAPPDKLGEVDQFLQDVLSLIDDGLMQSLTRKLRIVFQQAAADVGLMEALAIENRPHPEDFLSPVNGKNFLGHLLGYPRMNEVATETTSSLLRADGVDRQGNVDPSESTALADLMASMTISMRETQRTEPNDTVAYSLQTVLVSEDSRFGVQGSAPLWAVQYDLRGIPMVRKTDSGLAVPFVDNDGDGLADVDADGDFVLSTGEARDVPAFETRTDEQALLNRDPYGRGSAGGGEYVFEYVDLSKTGLHFMTRQLGRLTQRGIMWDVVEAMPAVLGPREVKTDAQGPFSGYSADNPITDLMYALLHSLDVDQIDEVFANLAEFMNRNSSELAGVAFALDEAVGVMDAHPEAGMEDDETVAHDLLPVLEQISADPDLWRDFFWALRQPVSRYTGEPLVTLMTHKDQNPAVPANDGSYDACFQACKARFSTFDSFDEANPQTCLERYAPQRALQRYQCIQSCPTGEIFSVPMDHDAPEALTNRSMFQRLLHLLRDAHQTPYGLAIIEPGWLSSMPALIDLPDSAGAMVRSIGGELDLADYVAEIDGLQPLIDLIGGASSVAGLVSTLSPLLGAKLDRRATPDQITRLFNLPKLSASVGGVDIEVAPPVCKDGYQMSLHHADILYASEASGLYDTMAPLACAFSVHDHEELLGEMFSVLHAHYSSRTDLYSTAGGSLSPMKGANMRSYEPALQEILERRSLFEALYRLSVAADRFKSDSGVDFSEQLRLIVHNAARTDDGFVGRNGETMITLADGRTVRELSRLHILMEAAGQMSARVENNPAAEAALENMVGALYDVMLAAQWPDGEEPSFQDPGSVALLAKITHHLSEKAAEARQQNRLSEWITGDQMQSILDVWNSRTLPALVDLSTELAANDQHKQLTDDLMAYMLGAPAGRNQAAMAAYVLMVYTLHQDTWVPLSRFLATVFDPNRDWEVEPYGKLPLTSHLLQLLHDSVALDTEGRGLEMFERGFSNRSDGSVPFGTVFGIVADYLRVAPASQQPYTADDYATVFDEFAAWLGDDVHGIEQLYDIVGQKVRD